MPIKKLDSGSLVSLLGLLQKQDRIKGKQVANVQLK